MHNLTKPQQLIYDMEKFAGGSIATVCGSIIIKGNKDITELTHAANELYRLNDALRIKITETDGTPFQTVSEYKEQEINVLRFKDNAEFNSYAENYAKEPMNFYGSLCHMQIIVLEDAYGILVKLHHIISDAWTLALIGSQFNSILKDETLQSYSYLDYISSEQKYLEGKRYQKDKDYYIEQFKKCDETTYLSDKQVQSYTANRKTFIVDKEKTAKITAYANENNSSLFMLLMTALGVYVNRIKMNQEKFYVGTAVLNRSGLAEQNAMGMFINTVPVLFELEDNSTFKENLDKFSENMMTMLRHQKFNYGDVLKTLRSEFDFNGNLYDVMLSYQNAKVVGMEDEFESTWYHCGMQTESLQIHIDDRDSEGILKIHYDYQVEKFTEKEIERMHEHIFNLLFDAINEDKKITELAVLSEDEKNTLLYAFNDTKADYPKDKCIHQLFEEQVLKTPEKIALKFANREFTYRELNGMANSIANKLRKMGVGKNDIVALISKRSYHLVVAILGIIKAGAAYLPIDYNYPQDRIDYIIDDAKCKAIVTFDVDIDRDNVLKLESGMFINQENLHCINVPNDLCAVIYTSGSTGTPKGTLLHHKGIVNYIYANNALYEGGNCNLGFAIYTFDAFFLDIIPPMIRGNMSVMATEDEQYHQKDFENLIKNNPKCNLFITPAKLKQFIDSSEDKSFINEINKICIGGEVFPDEFISLFHEETQVFNVYGPTECSMWMLEHPVVNNDVTLGKPLNNVQVYIVDKYNKPMPIGQIGELCIAGDGVGAGYLNRPGLTAEKFIDNPFGEGKMYKTGDLAYWREDGNIAYVGRNDFQVKIRGLRIELGEIESAIDSVEGVSQAVVVVRKDINGRQLICAFYTEQTTVDVADIKSAISLKLPKYMMPHIFTTIEEMPLTPSGKINRKALPKIDLTNISNDTEYVAPITDKETILCEAIKNILNAERVGTVDNFFDLGGDSLKAIELISKLEANGYKTTVKTVFDCETVKDLAEQLEQAEAKITPFEWACDIPATDAQMRVYTAQGMQENSTLYNVPYCFKTENLDITKLQNAVNKLTQRHEILRTHFENKDGHIIQVINDNVECNVEKLSSDNILDFIRPFDLEKAPLIRVGYFENTVMVDIHHIITDGSSMPVFFNELNELYMGRTLDNPPVQYKEFAVLEKDHTDSEKYWLSVFDDEVPVLEINTDFPRGNKQTHNGSALYDTIDIELHNKIKDKCKELNITPYAFYMSGFNILLSKFSGNEDVVVGMPISGRDSKFLNTMGMFVNTIALRNKPVGTKTVSEFLTEVKENSINAIANQDYPFGELIKKLNVETSNRNPIFDVMFAYQSEEMTDVIFGDKKAELCSIPITTSKYDLTLNVMPRENDVVLMAEYCTDLYKESTIKRMVEGYKLILSQMLDELLLIMDLSAITENERNKLLYSFNDTKADYPKDKCVHQLFEEQVVKTPNKIAVIACDRTLTYDELNKLSNRIANSLIEKGVKANEIVAFALPRNSYLIAVMFGILKSGAAYMPLDPSYPQERIDYMLSDSNAKFFITKDNINEFVSVNEVAPNVKISQKDIYCALHTSGSTGKPKLALLTHKNLMAFLYANHRFYDDCDATITVTVATFDVFMQDTVLSIAYGVKTILSSEDQIYNQYEFEKLFSLADRALFFSTPTKLKNYITQSETKEFLKHIGTFVVGGEVFPEELYELIISHLDKSKCYNGYGPTETTLCNSCSCYPPPENL